MGAKIILLFTLLALSENDPGKKDFAKIFGDKYNYALSEIRLLKNDIDSISNSYKVNGKFVTAIVFPELIRYSIIKDFVEKNSLELVYVNAGMADFSIGTFQIKPSFAENLEKLVIEEKGLNDYASHFVYSVRSPVEIRRERINRLKNTVDQIHYVCLFQKYMYMKHGFLENKSEKYQLMFLSTAYNSGFDSPRKTIDEGMNKEFFPWGALNEKKKYNYAEIAWYFYSHEYSDKD